MRSSFWFYFPAIELRRFRKIDFFPPRPSPELLSSMRTICLGTKNRTVGDALMLTTLPAKLRERHPNLDVRTYPRGFNPVAFHGNDAVSGLQFLPERLYGDDVNWGNGHLIQLKERFFDLPVSADPKPEIHLLENERSWIAEQVGGSAKPLVVIHPWGGTRKSVLTPEFWSELVRRWSARYRFWQVGLAGQTPVEGCERHFLLPRAYRHARKLFALMSRADLFLGVDSGPMHAARAFSVPSLIFVDHVDPARAFELRKERPYYAAFREDGSFLYEANDHIDLRDQEASAIMGAVDYFLEEHQG